MPSEVLAVLALATGCCMTTGLAYATQQKPQGHWQCPSSVQAMHTGELVSCTGTCMLQIHTASEWGAPTSCWVAIDDTVTPMDLSGDVSSSRGVTLSLLPPARCCTTSTVMLAWKGAASLGKEPGA